MNFGIGYKVANVQKTVNVIGFSMEDIALYVLALSKDATVDANSIIVTKTA